MSVEDILAAENELTHLLGAQQAVVLSTRIRLARNLEGLPFPGWAKIPQRKEIADQCVGALEALVVQHKPKLTHLVARWLDSELCLRM